MNAAAMGAILEQIRYTRDLGMVIEHAAEGEVRMLLPDQPLIRNIAGTVHAGALFTFGETVAGVAAGIETLDRAFPFARRAEIRYRQPARSAVRGHARVAAADVARVRADVERVGRSELTVSVELADPDGAPLAAMEVDYAFRPIGGQP